MHFILQQSNIRMSKRKLTRQEEECKAQEIARLALATMVPAPGKKRFLVVEFHESGHPTRMDILESKTRISIGRT